MSADITPFIEDAKKVQEATGIPASITLAQIILESSGKYAGGLSGLAASAKNLFGIKGSGTAGSVKMKTSEYVNGKYVTVYSDFRKYNSFYESMMDHAKFLSGPRYRKQFQNADSVNDYATGLQKAGYATSPTYASNLMKIIGSNNLHQYDTGNLSYKPVSGTSTPGSSTATSETSTTSEPSGVVGKFYFSTIRIILILMMFILMVIFFLKAFPAVDSAVSMVAPTPTKPLKMIKAMKGATE